MFKSSKTVLGALLHSRIDDNRKEKKKKERNHLKTVIGLFREELLMQPEAERHPCSAPIRIQLLYKYVRLLI